jgi:hypothetical protein
MTNWAENLFGELKNQWGWTALSTRAFFEQAVTSKSTYASQTPLRISRPHPKAMRVANLLGRISEQLQLFVRPAE